MAASDTTLARIAPTLPLNARDVARLQASAEAGRDAFDALAAAGIDCSEDYAFVDELLTDNVRLLDAEKAMRGSATGPLYGVIKTIEGWFKPLLAEREYAISVCKRVMGAYRLEQDRLAREARELVAATAEAGDGAALIEALEIADQAAAPVENTGASCGFRWVVKRVVREMLSRDVDATVAGQLLWVPNAEALAAVAAAHDGKRDDPPIVAGVVFERVAKIGARH